MNLVRAVVIYTRPSFLLTTYLSHLDFLQQPLICAYAGEMLCTAQHDEERKDRQVRVNSKEAPILLTGGAEGEPSA
ncbi:hypothetical protein FPG13_02915 [Salmonella enterica subsp. salamae]|nr:hypothetical protein [Salmonella enterica]EBP3979524.1 hypothetical protein [Salmonella enterica subsp. enterica]ECF5831892.1 hypothetical protein [Salmonella enterica subsp. salamae]EDU6434855.1 hypothetical protein [Salmonella enterica subsp. salamae serovar 47:b:e,n,x,z15]EAY5145846.1 hypothetical protein [Salmonella enterica]